MMKNSVRKRCFLFVVMTVWSLIIFISLRYNGSPHVYVTLFTSSGKDDTSNTIEQNTMLLKEVTKTKFKATEPVTDEKQQQSTRLFSGQRFDKGKKINAGTVKGGRFNVGTDTGRKLEAGSDEEQGMNEGTNTSYERKFVPSRLDPMSESIKPFINHPRKFECKQIQPMFTHLNDTGYLILNESAIYDYEQKLGSVKCQWKTIEKEFGGKDEIVDGPYMNFTKIPFRFPQNDMIQVECHTKSRLIYYNLHAFPHTLEEATSPPNEKQLSVYILYLESMSTSRFLRHMTSTYQYMRNTLDSIIFDKYNKVADNTYVNVMPLLTGRRSGNQQVNMKDEFKGFRVREDYFDNLSYFLWNDFRKTKYKSIFLEDTPRLGLFEYFKKGFLKKKPFDFYFRPFFLRQKKLEKLSSRFCFGNEPKMKLQLDIAKSIYLKYGKIQKMFVYDFYIELGHDRENEIERADESVKDFLQTLYENGSLNNTVLIMLGDHGARFGKVRQSRVGYLEERLPFLSMTFPKWFKKQYQKSYNALLKNTQRLVTPFDIHETLMDVVNSNYAGTQREYHLRQKSLFYTISPNRTCLDAGIPHHYCACYRMIERSNQLKSIRIAGKFLVDYINQLLKPVENKCAILRLIFIKNASEVYEKNIRDTKVKKYRVMVMTRPGDAIFETLVTHDVTMNKYSIQNDISRLTMYERQSKCVDKLKKYCFCKEK